MLFHIVKKSATLTKRIFLIVFVYFFIIGLFFYFFQKDKVQLNQNNNSIDYTRAKIYKTINDPKLTKTKEGQTTIFIYRSLMCPLVGEGCSTTMSDTKNNFNKSVFGSMSSLMATPYANPPASGTLWVYEGLSNVGFVPKTYAAEGIGFAGIKPMQGLWKIFRDVAYMILVLLLVSIGFMMMFRMKINAQTVISVENSIPKIVIALLLITFSFAIAGFLIDLMYLSMAIIISLLSNNNQYYDSAKYQNDFLSANPAMIIESLFPKKTLDPHTKDLQTLFPITSIPIKGFDYLLSLYTITLSLLHILPGFIQGFLWIIGIIATLFLASKIVNATGTFTDVLKNLCILGNCTGGVLPGILNIGISVIVYILLGALIIPLILILVILFTVVLLFFRIFFLLLTSYLKILFYIAFAPIFLLFEAVPGQGTFGYWLKNLIAELVTFPLVTIIFLTGYVLVNHAFNFTNLLDPNNVLTPFKESPWTPPYLFGFDQSAYAFILSTGILFITPDIVKFVKEALGAKDSPFNIGVGTFLAGGSVALSGGWGLLSQVHAIKSTIAGGPPGEGLWQSFRKLTSGGR